MAEFPTHKRIKDMNEEELQAFRDHMQKQFTPDELESLSQFFGLLGDVATVLNSDEAKASRAIAKQIFDGLREFVPIL